MTTMAADFNSTDPRTWNARRREPGVDSAADSASTKARGMQRLRVLAQLMDNQWQVPGTSYRVGLDAVIGLIPGAGDFITTGVQLYIVAEAYRMGFTKGVLAKMLGNIAIDWAVGLVPLAGDLFDAGFKANIRNLRLMGIDVGTPTRR